MKWLGVQQRRWKQVCASWRGQHFLIILNAAQSLVSVALQFVSVGRTHQMLANRGIFGALALEVASISIIGSCVSVVARRYGVVIDRHFRHANLHKFCLLILKLAFLVLPNAIVLETPADFRYIWSCANPVACPASCTDRYVPGTCLYSPPGASHEAHCVCAFKGAQDVWRQIVLEISICVTAGVTVNLLSTDVAKLWQQRADGPRNLQTRTPRPWLAIISYFAVVVSVQTSILLIGLGVTGGSPKFFKQPSTVLQIGAGLVALALFANEAKWVLEDCRPDRQLHGRKA